MGDRPRLKRKPSQDGRETDVHKKGKTMKPLYGNTTHPLTPSSRKTLEDIAKHPVPRQKVNPGVVNRLLREYLVEEVVLPSPYQKHKGACIAFLEITSKGLECLKNE